MQISFSFKEITKATKIFKVKDITYPEANAAASATAAVQ
jgi:hypothetical protein